MTTLNNTGVRALGFPFSFTGHKLVLHGKLLTD